MSASVKERHEFVRQQSTELIRCRPLTSLALSYPTLPLERSSFSFRRYTSPRSALALSQATAIVLWPYSDYRSSLLSSGSRSRIFELLYSLRLTTFTLCQKKKSYNFIFGNFYTSTATRMCTSTYIFPVQCC